MFRLFRWRPAPCPKCRTRPDNWVYHAVSWDCADPVLSVGKYIAAEGSHLHILCLACRYDYAVPCADNPRDLYTFRRDQSPKETGAVTP